MSMQMKNVWTILCLLCVLLLLGNAALAESFSIKDANGQMLMPNGSFYLLTSGEYTASGKTDKAEILIMQNEKVTLILDSATIDFSKDSGYGRSPIKVCPGAELTIVLADHSSNTLKANDGYIMGVGSVVWNGQTRHL